MALVKCTECGGQVSTQAVACPKCGAPVRVPDFVPDFGKSFGIGKVLGAIAAVYLAVIVIGYGIKLFDRWKESRAQEERKTFAAEQLKARTAEWQQNREPIVAEAKRHFIEGRPAEALRLLRPWEPVLDGEARAVFAAAEPQVAELLVKEKQAAETAAAKALSDAKEAKEASCRNDLQCWGPRHMADAQTACAPLIEAYAKNNFEWTDGWGEKFDKARLEGNGRITYLGNYIKFQNGFGAWSIMNYECTYDPSTKRALSATVESR
jgi:hypothetical protein